MVLFVSQSLQVLVVALAVFAFFVVFGAAGDRRRRPARPGSATRATTFSSRSPGSTSIRATSCCAWRPRSRRFSGLYYAIAVLVDPTYREEFLDEVTGDMRLTFAARTEYLALRAG